MFSSSLRQSLQKKYHHHVFPSQLLILQTLGFVLIDSKPLVLSSLVVLTLQWYKIRRTQVPHHPFRHRQSLGQGIHVKEEGGEFSRFRVGWCR